MSSYYLIEKLKKNGKPYSLPQFLFKSDIYRSSLSRNHSITTSMDEALSYKSRKWAEKKVYQIKKYFPNYNFGLFYGEKKPRLIANVFCEPVSYKLIKRMEIRPISSIKTIKKFKKIITRWQLIDID